MWRTEPQCCCVEARPRPNDLHLEYPAALQHKHFNNTYSTPNAACKDPTQRRKETSRNTLKLILKAHVPGEYRASKELQKANVTAVTATVSNDVSTFAKWEAY